MQATNRLWVIGTIILVAAILAMGWFLGVSPILDAVTANDEQRQSVEAQNLIQERSLAKIKKEFEQIDDLKSQLAEIRKVIPDNDDLSTFIGQLHELEGQSGVVLTSIATSDGMVFVPARKDAASTESGTTTIDAIPNMAALTKENFIVIPIDLKVSGSHAQVMSFVDALQKGTRLFLVINLTVAGDAVGQDSYSGSISGYVYVLLNSNASTDASAAPDESEK